MIDDDYRDLKAEATSQGYSLSRHQNRDGETVYRVINRRKRNIAEFNAYRLTWEQAEQIIRLVPVQDAVQHVMDHDAAMIRRRQLSQPLQDQIWALERQIAELHREIVKRHGAYTHFDKTKVEAMLASYVEADGRQVLEPIA